MATISRKNAREKYFEEGMDDVFTFDEYVAYLSQRHVTVQENCPTTSRAPEPRSCLDEKYQKEQRNNNR